VPPRAILGIMRSAANKLNFKQEDAMMPPLNRVSSNWSDA